MATTKVRTIATSALVAAAISGSIALAPSATAADLPPDFPRTCGMVHQEKGPLSSTIHQLEPSLRSLGLMYPLHGLNCQLVLNVEYLLGLQERPSGPGGPPPVG